MYPHVPSIDDIIRHFNNSLRESKVEYEPYQTFHIRNVFPIEVCTALLLLPIPPPSLGKTDGTRDTYNSKRIFFTPDLQWNFLVCERLCKALADNRVSKQISKTFSIDTLGSYLRVEYMQDMDGMWLEPHRDIPEKLFSMVVYLCLGPEIDNWGTDIYDRDKKWLKCSKADFNTAVVFKSGEHTWHGFEPRTIRGVRRLMEINYVRNDWRDLWQVSGLTN